jgi:N-acetylglutamate synthase-like GNAT family acetyltransferase
MREATSPPVEPAVVVRPATPNDLEHVERLLSTAALPLDGVREHFDGFVVAERGGSIVGCAAVERYTSAGLLRSVAVDQSERSKGTGAVLVEQCIANAAHAGIDTLVLLTTTAERYFPRFGFEVVDRTAVPEAVRESAEFRGACPASATVMRRTMALA